MLWDTEATTAAITSCNPDFQGLGGSNHQGPSFRSNSQFLSHASNRLRSGRFPAEEYPSSDGRWVRGPKLNQDLKQFSKTYRSNDTLFGGKPETGLANPDAIRLLDPTPFTSSEVCMSLRCDNCESLFFKTLETRIVDKSNILLYKKRCKRCKYKYLFQKDLTTGHTQVISLLKWQSGCKVAVAGSKIADRARLFVSEYSGRISRAPEDQLAYLQKIKHAEGIRHEWQKTTG